MYLVRMLLIACPWDRGSWCSMPVRYSKIWQMGPQAYGTTLPAFHTMHCSYLNYHRYCAGYFFQEPKNFNLYNLDFLLASKHNSKLKEKKGVHIIYTFYGPINCFSGVKFYIWVIPVLEKKQPWPIWVKHKAPLVNA